MTSERLNGLASAGHVTVLHLGEPGDQSPSPGTGALEVVAAGRLRPRTALGLVSSYCRGQPLSVWRNSDPAYARAARTLRNEAWDLLYADHWLVWEAARGITAAHKVLHLHNAEPELFLRAASGLSGVRRVAALLEFRRACSFLRRAVAEAQELHLLSPADHDALASRGIHHPVTRVFLPAVSSCTHRIAPFEARGDAALFVGSLSWPPNDEGLQWFLRDVWPLRNRVRKLEIAGAGASAALASAARASGVRLSGFVEDLEPLYAAARCLAAPLLSGSGIKIKIINALVRGLPVVTTPIGAEGMPDGGGAGTFVARSPSEFAEHVDRLVVDEHVWSRASAAAWEYARRHFTGTEFSGWCGRLRRS